MDRRKKPIRRISRAPHADLRAGCDGASFPLLYERLTTSVLPRRRFLGLTAATVMSGAVLAACESLTGTTLSLPGDDQLGPYWMLVGVLDEERSLVYYTTENERTVANQKGQFCNDTKLDYPTLTLQLHVPAAVYYPYNGASGDIAHTIERGPFPVI